MGILDDAIREHLDLKRRQGAEEDELKRLEGEAFGPPSRPGDPDFPEQAPAAEQATAEPVTGEEPTASPVPAEEPVAPATDAAPAAGLYDRSGDEFDLDEPAPPPPPPAPPATDEQAAVEPEAEPPIESLDTVEHHYEGAVEDTGEAELVEGELADESKAGEEEEEDVLEETPEFLRDAPEDDELWFEQGEPKDFDF